MKRCLQLVTLLALLALLLAPTAQRPVVHSAAQRVVIFEGFFIPT